MVWNADNEESQLIYDLRQIYANEVIKPTLNQIKFFRTANNYSGWFESLRRDLRVEISKELTEVELKEINEKINKVLKIIKANEMAYVGRDNSPERNDKIKEELCELEMLMMSLMEKHKMFGKTKEVGRI